VNKLIAIIFVLISIGGMFYFSTQTAIDSSIQSQFFIDLIYKLSGVRLNSYIIRKLAHVFMFMMISISIVIFVYMISNNIIVSIGISSLISIGYACLDEYIQTFIEGRSGNIKDVMIDCIGVIIGILIIGGLIWIIKKK
jgi:VanZ family protein